MRITEKQLRTIVREGVAALAGEKNKNQSQKLSEVGRSGMLYPEDCKPGKNYNLGYRNIRFTSRFVGWKIEDGRPLMAWENLDDNMGWEAYMSGGVMCVGSSADKLIIYGEIL